MSSARPCPFCGSPAIVRHASMYAVCCTKCHAELALVYREEDDAIIAWNRRATDALLADAMKLLETATESDWMGDCIYQWMKKAKAALVAIRKHREET